MKIISFFTFCLVDIDKINVPNITSIICLFFVTSNASKRHIKSSIVYQGNATSEYYDPALFLFNVIFDGGGECTFRSVDMQGRAAPSSLNLSSRAGVVGCCYGPFLSSRGWNVLGRSNYLFPDKYQLLNVYCINVVNSF